MAVNKIDLATDGGAELSALIGDDASATFESDANFVNSNPTADASSDPLELRDTDDTEDSEEEEDESGLEDEDYDEEDEDEDDEDEDDDEDEFEDDEDDDDPDELRVAEPRDVHGPGKRSRTDIEKELQEMEDEVGEEDVEEAPEAEEEEDEGEEGQARRHADRAMDEGLRMSVRTMAGLDIRVGAASLEQVG
ncbi:MAG: hypothetical protein ABR971_06000 [Acidobacteriaceae bacterium]|jgi:hypothetical protein